VFEVNPISHTLTTLAAFHGTNGANPDGRLLFDSSGNLFGTTSAGGSDGSGTVFEVAAGSHALITLASFHNAGYGGSPIAGLIADASGDLFGTTYEGGDNGNGSVFEVTAGTHSLITLASLDGTNGATPYGDLLAGPGGTLYGTAYYGGPTFNGGASGLGTVFAISPVPEPSTIALIVSALFAFGPLRSRLRRSA
jgi:uncharacterized repeat protein (TIGR03803 family)